MSFQRAGLRLSQQLRSPVLRRTVQRRFESSHSLPQPGDKLVGARDNAFNRERAAVKAHAAATSGKLLALLQLAISEMLTRLQIYGGDCRSSTNPTLTSSAHDTNTTLASSSRA